MGVGSRLLVGHLNDAELKADEIHERVEKGIKADFSRVNLELGHLVILFDFGQNHKVPELFRLLGMPKHEVHKVVQPGTDQLVEVSLVALQFDLEPLLPFIDLFLNNVRRVLVSTALGMSSRAAKSNNDRI